MDFELNGNYIGFYRHEPDKVKCHRLSVPGGELGFSDPCAMFEVLGKVAAAAAQEQWQDKFGAVS